MGTIWYRPYKPKRRVHIRRISDKTFYRGLFVISLLTGYCVYAAYKFFIG
jgi:hypothetical protein